MQNDERLCYDVGFTAKLLGLSRNSVYQGCLTGEIPHVKVGKRILIPRLRLERWLQGIDENGNGHEERKI